MNSAQTFIQSLRQYTIRQKALTNAFIGENDDWLRILINYKGALYAPINAYSRKAILPRTGRVGVQYKYPMINVANSPEESYAILSTNNDYFLHEPWEIWAIDLIFLNDLALFSAQSLIAAPIRVYRGIAWTQNTPWQQEFKTGGIINQVTLWSTSLHRSTAMDFYGDPCCLFVIDLPAHYPAIWLEGYGKSEAEFLLVPFRKDGTLHQFKIVEQKQETITYRVGELSCYRPKVDVENCLQSLDKVTREITVIYCVPNVA